MMGADVCVKVRELCFDNIPAYICTRFYIIHTGNYLVVTCVEGKERGPGIGRPGPK